VVTGFTTYNETAVPQCWGVEVSVDIGRTFIPVQLP
jgi:hypothetical protein